jgi:glycosyltransferase involved in cell wall biosynthesis
MPPRIAHVITTFYPTNTSAWVSALADDQKARGWEVELIVGRNASPELLEQKRRQGFFISRINSLRKYVHPAQDAATLWNLFRRFRNHDYDLVHTHLAKAGVLGRLAARAAGVPNIVHSVYGATFAPTQPWCRRLLFKNLEKLAGRCTDRFIFVGQDLCHAYRQAGICSNGKAEVIYYGKDISPFLKVGVLSPEDRRLRKQAAGFAPEALILGNVSRLVPWKGLHHALQVVRALKDKFPQLRLIVVGDAKTPSEGAYKATLLDLVQSLGLTKKVIFTGWQPDPAPYYAIFDLYLLTSQPFEGVPGSVIEAVVAGLPLVGFDCFGLREIPGISARLARPGDLSGLIALVEEELSCLIGGRPLRPMAEADIARLKERFSLSRMVQQTFELYRTLLEGRKAPLTLEGTR